MAEVVGSGFAQTFGGNSAGGSRVRMVSFCSLGWKISRRATVTPEGLRLDSWEPHRLTGEGIRAIPGFGDSEIQNGNPLGSLYSTATHMSPQIFSSSVMPSPKPLGKRSDSKIGLFDRKI
jgi:hypothetical protein